MISNVEVSRAVDVLNLKACDEHAYKRLMQLFCIFLDGLTERMPPAASNAYRSARVFWFGGVYSKDGLQDLRVHLWGYLDGIEKADPLAFDATVTRAVICVLYPFESDSFDCVDILEWFVSLLNRMGDFSSVFSSMQAKVQKSPL